ncbi:MAG: VapC toxin family PIN domain ribonuclease [Deltaproteobacteria bacterium HGW-Deltaproteobacteria-4]|nr:MAG: VapC toxin family PIN domain ribonuclease [Deltaproteobacteria bacterium HGW-Deltaproteobacteria-4]
MRSIFIDTSAFLAVLDADDDYHSSAKSAWGEILASASLLVTSNYILVETFALVQNRLGLQAIRIFQEDIVPLLSIRWVDAPIHAAATSALLAANRKKLSLVDCVSFEVMRHAAIRSAFTFDRHFKEQGFDCVPNL